MAAFHLELSTKTLLPPASPEFPWGVVILESELFSWAYEAIIYCSSLPIFFFANIVSVYFQLRFIKTTDFFSVL